MNHKMITIGYDAKRAFHNTRGLGSYSRLLLEGVFNCNKGKINLYSPHFQSSLARLWHLKNSHNYSLYTPPKNSKLSEMFWRSFQLEKNMQDHKLDIFHGLSNEIPYIRKNNKTKVVVTVHDLIFLRYPKMYSRIDRFIYTKKTSYACQQADCVIAISKQTKTDLIELLNVPEKKITIIPPICDKIFYKTIDPHDLRKFLASYHIHKPYFLFVGAFDPRKNIKNIIKAFFQSQSQSNMDLVLIGTKNSYQDQIKALVKKLDLNTKVKFLSKISRSQLPYFYQGSFGFVFPTLFEGFGIPIVEALASKTPLITSKLEHFKDLCENNAYFADPDKPEDIAKQMNEVFYNKHQRLDMIDRGEKTAQKFCSSSVSDKLFSLYQNTL